MKIYTLNGRKVYEGNTLLGAFATQELAETAKEIAEMMRCQDFDSYTVKSLEIHTELLPWKKYFRQRFFARRYKRTPNK